MWVEVLCWIDRLWSSKECVCCTCDPSVHLDAPSIRVDLDLDLERDLDHMCLLMFDHVVSLCDIAYYVMG